MQAQSGKSSEKSPGNSRLLLITCSAPLHHRITASIGSDRYIEIVHQKSGIGGIADYRRSASDVVILDVDGQTDPNWPVTITAIRRIDPHAIIVMMSGSNERHDVKAYTEGLARGATDFLAVPGAHENRSAKRSFDQALNTLIHASTEAKRRLDPIEKPATKTKPPLPVKKLYDNRPIVLRPAAKQRPKALAIASSTGGPRALIAVLSVLPRDIGLPVFITQHMPAGFTASLAQNITTKTSWLCHEGVDGMEVLPGYIYMAPGGFHMELEQGAPYHRIRITDSDPENFCKPSADPMIRSLVDVYGADVLLTVLTGMGTDGLAGATQLIDAGGTVVAQDEATSVVWGMPGAVATSGLCSAVIPIDAVANEITRISRGVR